MTYVITLKDSREYTVDQEKIESIRSAWTKFIDQGIKTMVTISDDSFTTFDIKTIGKKKIDNESKRQSGNKMIEQANQDYFQERKRFLALRPSEKVTQRRQFLNFLWNSFSSQNIPEDRIAEVKEITLKFYQENKNRMFPNPTLYKHLMPDRQIGFGVGVIVNLLKTDIFYSKK